MQLSDNRDEMEHLERLMDRYGTTEVLTAVRDVLEAKGAHLREAWQDEVGGMRWTRAARRVDALLSVKGGLPT